MPYCCQPFSNIRLDSNGTGPQFKPCCHYKDEVASTIDTYLVSDKIRSLKETLLTDSSLPDACIVCRSQERKNQISWRQKYNEIFKSSTDTEITRFEIFINNTCNLKCFMCSPTYSTALGSEWKQLGWVNDYQSQDYFDQAIDAIKKIHTLNFVSFIGGEFFLSKNVFEILELLVDKKISVGMSTNATTLSNRHLDLLSQLPSVDIQISLDGIQDSYNFMRYPGDWNQVQSNINQLKTALPGQKLHANTVVQPLNFQYISALAEWCNQNLLSINLTNLQMPAWLEWRILTPNEKSLLISHVRQELKNKKLTTSQKQTIENFCLTILDISFDDVYRKEFIDKMSQIVKLRNLSQDQINKHFGCLTDLADKVTK